jgi:hypothetical protein
MERVLGCFGFWEPGVPYFQCMTSGGFDPRSFAEILYTAGIAARRTADFFAYRLSQAHSPGRALGQSMSSCHNHETEP